jgi:hypothetical protein
MGYVTSNLGRPILGVSQQAPKIRLLGQCTEQENLISDIIRGLITRAGSYHKSFLEVLNSEKVFFHHYSKEDTDEDYIIAIDENGLARIFSPDGTEHTVVYAINQSYLATSTPYENIVAQTIADTTFLVNKTTVVLEESALTSVQGSTSIIYVRFADYSETIKIFLDGSEIASLTITDGVDPSDKIEVGTDYVAAQLRALCVTNVPAGFTVSAVNANTFWITKDNGTAFTMSSNDDSNGDNTIIVKESVTGVDKLPLRAPDDFLIKIASKGTANSINDFWLKSVSKSDGTVYWQETTEPNISSGIKRDTMPMQLVRTGITLGISSFTLEFPEWEDRTVGTELNNPQPPFIGNTINAVSYFQNRLVLASSEFLVFSRSGISYSFYKETGQKTLDGDVISVYADTDFIIPLKHILPFDGDLFISSGKSQLIVSGDKPLTPSNTVMRLFTTFENNTQVSPIATGENIVFPFRYGQNAGLREFYTDSISSTKRALPITDHVKEYMPADLKWMLSSTKFNKILVCSRAELNAIYTYDWIVQGSERLQSAWSKWTLADEGARIEFAYLQDSSLFMVIKYPLVDEVVVEELDMSTIDDEGVTFHVRLDRKKLVEFTKVDSRWEAVDYLYDEPNRLLGACKTTGCYQEEIGTSTDVFREGVNLVTEEDLGEGATAYMIVGVPIFVKYTMTNPFPRDREGRAKGDMNKLTVSSVHFHYDVTGTVTAKLETGSGVISEKIYNNRFIGSANNTVGYSESTSGTHRVPIRQKSDRFELTLLTEDIFPLQIREMEFDGNYNPRGRKI